MPLVMTDRRLKVMPGVGARALHSHPLCPRFGYVFNGGIVDIVRNHYVQTYTGTIAWKPTVVRGYAGMAMELNGSSAKIGQTTELLANAPTAATTTIIGGYLTDLSTQSNVVTYNGGTSSYQMFIPNAAGEVKFNYGSGPSHDHTLTATGLTIKADDIWGFVGAGSRGDQEIWQNGIKVANAAETEGPPYGGDQILLQAPGAAFRFAFFFLYWRTLLPEEFSALAADPFVWAV